MARNMKARPPAKPVFQPKQEHSQSYFPDSYPDPYVVQAIYQILEECLPEEYRARFERTGEVELFYEMPFLPANWVRDAEVPDELRRKKLTWVIWPDGMIHLRLIHGSSGPPGGFDDGEV